MSSTTLSTGAITISIACTLFITFLCVEWTLFSLHPVLMTFSFSFLIVEGLLTARNISVKPMNERKKLTNDHVYLQFGTLVFAVIGFVAAFWNKVIKGKRHFKSWHSWIGLLMMVGLLLEIVLGMYLYYPKFRSLLFARTTTNSSGGQTGVLVARIKRTKSWHKYLGMFVFYTGVVSMILGMYSNYMKRTLPYETVRLVIVLALLLLMVLVWLVMRDARSSSVDKLMSKKSPEASTPESVLPSSIVASSPETPTTPASDQV